MTDEEIAIYANITAEQAAKLREVAPNHVVMLDAMRIFEHKWAMHLLGLGPKPIGVVVNEMGEKTGLGEGPWSPAP